MLSREDQGDAHLQAAEISAAIEVCPAFGSNRSPLDARRSRIPTPFPLSPPIRRRRRVQVKQHSPSYSVILRLRYPDLPGMLGQIASTIGEADGSIGSVDIVQIEKGEITRDIVVSARDVEHGEAVVERVGQIPGVTIVRVADRTFLLHHGGKIEIRSKSPVKTRDDLSMVYTPGVARVCRAIAADPDASFSLTIRKNTVAVVSDGSAVLGLGNIGPRAAMPVMEGKCMLFKEFGGVDAFPICLDTQNVDEIVKTVAFLAPTFGGINLEDISSPRCVEVEQRLIAQLDIPVFHDDQHGTAVVVSAALHNALKVVEKKLDRRARGDSRRRRGGGGHRQAADVDGLRANRALRSQRRDRPPSHARRQSASNSGSPKTRIPRASPARCATPCAGPTCSSAFPAPISSRSRTSNSWPPTRSCSRWPIPTRKSIPRRRCRVPGSWPRAGPTIRTRSTTCSVFPGLFRGMLDVRALRVTEAMKIAAARAIADIIPEDHIRPDYIVPSVFDKRVAADVAKAVSQAAIEAGVAAENTAANCVTDCGPSCAEEVVGTNVCQSGDSALPTTDLRPFDVRSRSSRIFRKNRETGTSAPFRPASVAA